MIKDGPTAGTHKGEVSKDHRGLAFIAPLVNGRYGTVEYLKKGEYGDRETGIVRS